MISRIQAVAIAIAGATTVFGSSVPAWAQEAPGVENPAAAPAPAAPTPPSDLPPPEPTPASPSVPPPPVEPNLRPDTGRQTAGVEPAAPAPAPALPAWLQSVTLGGGLLAWYYQPIGVDAQDDVSIFFANLLLDGKWGRFGLHLEPRFRDTKLRPFYDGPVWLQEAYASVDLDVAELRVGKTYSQLGLFWDNSFYGNVQVYDGLKLDPDYGVSLQGNAGGKTAPFSLGWWAQYFVVDGGTNVSLPGRDTISIPRARRRNQSIGRIQPTFRFGSATLALGGSGEFLQAADLPGLGTQNVWRAAADAKLTIAGFGAWGEYTRQDGTTVTDFPVPMHPSSKIDYALFGGEYTLGPVTARYNASLGSYTDVAVREWMHVPAVGVAVSPNLSFLGELVIWRRYTPTGDSFVDRSFDLTLSAHL